MSGQIPISAARDILREHDCRQVIVLAWDGEFMHIVTCGKNVDDCAQAAAGGNMLKEKWGWPECNDQPSRVKKLEVRIEELEKQLKARASLAPANKLDCVGGQAGKISFQEKK